MRQGAAASIATLALALSALACAGAPDPASTTCLRVLSRRLPEARVVDVDAARGQRAVVRFELPERDDEAQRRLECTVEQTGSGGGWRVRSATLDGVALTNAELAVVNADLFLHELARAGSQ